jgi:hypothetical protein
MIQAPNGITRDKMMLYRRTLLSMAKSESMSSKNGDIILLPTVENDILEMS